MMEGSIRLLGGSQLVGTSKRREESSMLPCFQILPYEIGAYQVAVAQVQNESHQLCM